MHRKISRIRLAAMLGVSVFTLLMVTFVFSSKIAAQRDDRPPAHNLAGLGR